MNSDVVSISQPHTSWGYQHSGILSRSSSAISTFPAMTAPASYPGSSVAAPSYPSSTSLMRLHPVGNHTGISYANGSRPPYPINYSGFSDDMSEPYGMPELPSPQYQLQGQESHLPSVNYSSPDMSRSWIPVSNARQAHNFTLEPEGSSKYVNPSFPMPSAPLSTATTLASKHSHFPAMNTLETSLPTCDQIHNRVLPALGSKMASASKGHRNPSILSGDGIGTSIPTPLNYRSGTSWGTDNNGNDGNQHSVASSTSSTISNNVEDPGSNSSSSPQMSQNSTSFGYRPGQHDRDSNYNSTYNSSTTALLERQVGLDSGLSAELSNDHIIPGQDSSSNQYTYSLGSSTKHSAGTLVNGQSYMRLQEPPNIQSFDNLNHLGHTTTYHPHRASISEARHH